MPESITKPKQTETIQRYIGQVQGTGNGPTLFFFGGIHGNEMAGVKAIEHVLGQLRSNSRHLKGGVFGIRGNIPAQLVGKRFLADDLNRIWTNGKIAAIRAKTALERNPEEAELVELYELISKLLDTQSPPFYFIDFHTTSSKTLPFVTINDALINRNFSKLFPVPIILGIEEYLEGPLLSHMNERGYVSLGFESGQHNELIAVKNGIAFMWLALVFAGALSKKDVSDFEVHYRQLQISANSNTNFYEVTYRHELAKENHFKMIPGFKSFEKVQKGEAIGIQNKKEVRAEKNGIIFMPLYQEQGEEGFFLIKRIPRWALKSSVFLRKIKIDGLLTLLPGISWSDNKRESLLVNIVTAKFFAKPFFHLLGYRNRTIDKSHILMHNRERSAKNKMYRKEGWF